MTSQRVFETESIDLAAYLAAAGHEATILRNLTGKRAVFEFAETEELQKAVINYERGATLPAKRLLNTRSWLFREASHVVREGTGHGR
jgi:hypothetical protein